MSSTDTLAPASLGLPPRCRPARHATVRSAQGGWPAASTHARATAKQALVANLWIWGLTQACHNMSQQHNSCAQHTRRTCSATPLHASLGRLRGRPFPAPGHPRQGARGAGRRAPGASLASFEPRSSCGTLRYARMDSHASTAHRPSFSLPRRPTGCAPLASHARGDGAMGAKGGSRGEPGGEGPAGVREGKST